MTMILLGVSMLIAVFLIAAVDIGLFYVHKQQLRSAVEAAVTAGVQQARYWMTVELTKEYIVMVPADSTCVIKSDSGEEKKCPDTAETRVQVESISGWEKEIWEPHRVNGLQFDQVPALQGREVPALQGGEVPVLEGHCFAAATTRTTRCTQARVTGCEMREYPDGGAWPKADRTFQANSSKWQGRLIGALMVRTAPPESLKPDPSQVVPFRMDLAATARMPTMFLGLLNKDWRELPMQVSVSAGAHLVRAGADPCDLHPANPWNFSRGGQRPHR